MAKKPTMPAPRRTKQRAAVLATLSGAKGPLNAQEILRAASEQSDGIGQVNTAVTQLDQMTQQNAALVEQSAAAAQSLSEQAGKLAGVVSTFKLDALPAAA